MLEETNGAGTVTLDGFFLVRGSLFVINRLFKDGTGTRQSRPLKREKERLKHERQYEDAPPQLRILCTISSNDLVPLDATGTVESSSLSLFCSRARYNTKETLGDEMQLRVCCGQKPARDGPYYASEKQE